MMIIKALDIAIMRLLAAGNHRDAPSSSSLPDALIGDDCRPPASPTMLMRPAPPALRLSMSAFDIKAHHPTSRWPMLRRLTPIVSRPSAAEHDIPSRRGYCLSYYGHRASAFGFEWLLRAGLIISSGRLGAFLINTVWPAADDAGPRMPAGFRLDHAMSGAICLRPSAADISSLWRESRQSLSSSSPGFIMKMMSACWAETTQLAIFRRSAFSPSIMI